MNLWLLHAGLIPLPDHWEHGEKSIYYLKHPTKEKWNNTPKYILKEKSGEIYTDTKEKRKYMCEIIKILLTGERKREIIYEKTKKWRPLTRTKTPMTEVTGLRYITYARRLMTKGKL